jgi:cytochrome c oxidase subunit 3
VTTATPLIPDHAPRPVAHQFDDPDQQHHAVTIGVLAFLATEVLLFGTVLTGYTVGRIAHPGAFAEGSRALTLWIGAANTAILLCSSGAVALSVGAARAHRLKATRLALAAGILLGAAFLGLKAYEYWKDIAQDHLLPGAAFHPGEWSDPGAVSMFLFFYWTLTALHALHMLIGLAVLSFLALRLRTARALVRGRNTLHAAGLYWHFVDTVWVVLLPLLYMVK